MPLPITSITAAVAAIMLIVLGALAGMQRSKTGTLLGTGTDETLLRRIRAHGNFTEYVPVALIVLALSELAGHGSTILWVMAGLLIIGRSLHAYAILNGMLWPRGVGMLMTFASMLTGVVLLLFVR